MDCFRSGTLIWTKAATHGTAPAPRDSHTCSSFKNKFIVLGGEDSSNSYLSDIYILDAGMYEQCRTEFPFTPSIVSQLKTSFNFLPICYAYSDRLSLCCLRLPSCSPAFLCCCPTECLVVTSSLESVGRASHTFNSLRSVCIKKRLPHYSFDSA